MIEVSLQSITVSTVSFIQTSKIIFTDTVHVNASIDMWTFRISDNQHVSKVENFSEFFLVFNFCSFSAQTCICVWNGETGEFIHQT